MSVAHGGPQEPLKHVDQWDDYVAGRYRQGKDESEFRKYEADTPIAEFYRQNHAGQTLDFVLGKEREYGSLSRGKRGIWEAVEYLNTLVDDSDPDTDLSQIEHLLQTSEACRRDQRPDWFILAGLVHDLGKILCLWGEPQWAVVGDTFPVGCAFSSKIVFQEFFAANPDSHVAEYQTRLGVYEENGGLDKVDLSWGHDEYVYQVMKDYLPEEARYILRYHSFYPAHLEGEYQYLMSEHDREMFRWVREFNAYDLYSKSHQRPDAAVLRPDYEDLIARYFPPQIAW